MFRRRTALLVSAGLSRPLLALVSLILLSAAGLGALAATDARATLTEEIFRARLAAVREATAAGRYVEADAQALALVDEAEAWRPDDLPVAEAIDALIQLRARADGYALPRTEALARRGIAIKAARLGADSLDVAASITTFAPILRLTNQVAEARTLSERALAIRERALGPDHIDVARTLIEVGSSRSAQHDEPGAMAALERALAIIERPAAGATDADLSLALFRLSVATQTRADVELRWAERAVAVDDRSLPAGHPLRARALNGLGAAYANQDNTPAADAQFAKAVALLDASVGPNHPMVVIPLSNLCRMRTLLGEYVSAIRLCDRVAALAEAVFGPDHPRLAGALDAQVRLRLLLGDQAGAITRLERSLTLLERQTPVDTLHLVGVLNNLAVAREQVGEIDAALAHSTRSLEELARAGQQDAAWIIPPLTNQARLFARLNRPADAAAALARAKTLAEPAGSWMEIYAVQAAAYVAQWQGDAAASLPGYRRSIELWEALSSPEDVQALAPRTWYASALAQTGDHAGARREIATIDALGLTNLRLTARGLGEHQALDYARQMLTGRNLALSLLTHERTPAHADVAATYDAIVRSRAVVLDEMAARRRAVAAADRQPEVQARWATLIAARERLARLTVGRGDNATPAERARRVSEARAARDAAERSLAEVSTAFREEQVQDRAGFGEVAAALPADAALVSFVRYTPSPMKAGPLEQHPEDAYAAFIIRPAPARAAATAKERTDAAAPAQAAGPEPAKTPAPDVTPDVAFVPLGGARDIDASIAAWRESIDSAIASGGVAAQRTESAYRRAGAALRARIWDPVDAILAAPAGDPKNAGQKDPSQQDAGTAARGGASGDTRKSGAPTRAARLFIVPDAALHLVDFQVLPVGDTRYLVEQGPSIHYLLAERDLLRPAPAARNMNFLALGNPDFTRTETAAWMGIPARTPGANAAAPALAQATPPPSTPARTAPAQTASAQAGPAEAAPAESTLSTRVADELAPTDRGRSASDERHVSRSACDIVAGQAFPPLPGARNETQRIFEMWGRMWPRAKFREEGYTPPATRPDRPSAVELTDAQATEAAFKALAPGQGILHVATHGFFMDERCRAAREEPPAPTRGEGRNVSRSAQFSDESPLLRAGLVLAGANRRDAADVHDDDGMLTAEEIASLDLSRTEWAVLSACNTGRGDWQAGEGVMGLRRAFQIAGARTVIMSLWAVDDAVSERWMTALYEQRFLKRASTVDAVRAAGRTLLADRRARKQSTHPIYWAGFIAAGDWR